MIMIKHAIIHYIILIFVAMGLELLQALAARVAQVEELRQNPVVVLCRVFLLRVLILWYFYCLYVS